MQDLLVEVTAFAIIGAVAGIVGWIWSKFVSDENEEENTEHNGAGGPEP